MKPGIELVHKPVGVTSFSLVQTRLSELARLPGKRLPLCHGGTLDPFASGLLLMLYGGATRLMELHHAIPKTYVATIRWGTETDNGDLLGKVTASGDANALTEATLLQAVKPFLGFTKQIPPTTSAKKVGGEPAYRKVHRGEEVVLPPSDVYLHAARWRAHALPHHSELELTCRGGYYVRSLARDLGRAVGCFAHVSALQRTAIGPWADPGEAPGAHLTAAQLLPWCRSRQLSDKELGELRAERPIEGVGIEPESWALPEGWPDPKAPIRAFHLGKLVALLRSEAGALRATGFFRGGL